MVLILWQRGGGDGDIRWHRGHRHGRRHGHWRGHGRGARKGCAVYDIALIVHGGGDYEAGERMSREGG